MTTERWWQDIYRLQSWSKGNEKGQTQNSLFAFNFFVWSCFLIPLWYLIASCKPWLNICFATPHCASISQDNKMAAMIHLFNILNRLSSRQEKHTFFFLLWSNDFEKIPADADLMEKISAHQKVRHSKKKIIRKI